jgi:SAM-dependent methyltransferase
MEKFICVKDKGELFLENGEYICKKCGKTYQVVDEIPIFIDNLSDFYEEEKQYIHELDIISSIHYEEIRKLNFYIRSRISEILLQKGFRNKKGLDIGCGTGRNENFEHIYTKVTKDVIGVEVSLTAAKRFKKNFPDALCILATALPFEDESFDFITASGLVHHLIGHPHRIVLSSFKEWYRVLKIGGIICLNDPNLLYPISLMMHIPNRILQKIKPGARGRVPYERPILFSEIKTYT